MECSFTYNCNYAQPVGWIATVYFYLTIKKTNCTLHVELLIISCILLNFATEDYRIETRPVPEIGDGEVLVKVLAVGICASDVKCYNGASYYWGMCDATTYYCIVVFGY